LFTKSARANWLVPWHQDRVLPVRQRLRNTPGWGPWSHKGGVLHANAPAAVLAKVVAIRVHLDDTAPENGGLKVLPGTIAWVWCRTSESNRSYETSSRWRAPSVAEGFLS
jgi:hypothetical protein